VDNAQATTQFAGDPAAVFRWRDTIAGLIETP